MKTSIHRLNASLALAALGWLLMATACQTPQHDPWHYTAERTIYTAVQTADKFLDYEAEHRAALDAQVTELADAIREVMPSAVNDTRAAMALYRQALLDGAETEDLDYLELSARANLRIITDLAATAARTYAALQHD